MYYPQIDYDHPLVEGQEKSEFKDFSKLIRCATFKGKSASFQGTFWEYIHRWVLYTGQVYKASY